MRYRTPLHSLFRVSSFGDVLEHAFYRMTQPIFHRNAPSLFIRSFGRDLINTFDGYQGQGARGDTGNLGLGFVHFALVTACKPKQILCIGSKRGYIPAVLALACKENGVGHVDFVDAAYDKQDRKRFWGGAGTWGKVNPKDHFSFLDIQKHMTVHVMTSQDFFRRNKKRYQYIYIDGDHSYEGVKRDYNLSWQRLDKNGFMVFHDVVPKRMPGQPQYGVWRFWAEIRGNKITLSKTGTGLGILQK